MRIPQAQVIFIAPTGQTRAFLIPFQATHFLFMAAIDTGGGGPRLSQIVLDNAGIAGPRRHPLRLTGIPRQGRHAAGMRGIAHGRIRGMQRRRNGLNLL